MTVGRERERYKRATPSHRAYEGPGVLSRGFRPFFLLAGVWAPLSLGIFLAAYLGYIELPSAMDARAWHAHEMLFGFVAAAVAGFLLTAIPNWTGRLPLQGVPLLALVVLWIAGRAAIATSALIGSWSAAVLDLAFLTAFVVVIAREIVAGRNWRNLPVVTVVSLLLISNVLSHAQVMGFLSQTGLAERFAIAVVVSLITLIGGRIVPSFTHNWLMKRGAVELPARSGVFDYLTLGLTAIALARWVVDPEGMVTGVLAGLAGAANLVRLVRWRGWHTFPEPLLWVMHLGYLWVAVGLVLLAVAAVSDLVPPSGPLHALTAGAMGTMTLAVMSRATLGHSGEPLHGGAAMSLAYLLVTLAAVSRVAAAICNEATVPLLLVAGVAWISAFVFYLAAAGPLLLRARR